jgi:hypothetical protein
MSIGVKLIFLQSYTRILLFLMRRVDLKRLIPAYSFESYVLAILRNGMAEF